MNRYRLLKYAKVFFVFGVLLFLVAIFVVPIHFNFILSIWLGLPALFGAGYLFGYCKRLDEEEFQDNGLIPGNSYTIRCLLSVPEDKVEEVQAVRIIIVENKRGRIRMATLSRYQANLLRKGDTFEYKEPVSESLGGRYKEFLHKYSPSQKR